MSDARPSKRPKNHDLPGLDTTGTEDVAGLDQQLLVTRLGTPGTETLLSFPYPFNIPKRFKVNEHAQRTIFGKLYDFAMSMNSFSKKCLHVHGPLGVGKSHQLAAVAVAMQRAGRNIIYI